MVAGRIQNNLVNLKIGIGTNWKYMVAELKKKMQWLKHKFPYLVA